jgi:hypothetical protein
MKTFAVCIVNYNALDFLRDCLHSVAGESPDEIIVVDNASTDGSVAMVREEFPSVRLIDLKSNLGYGSAANRAVGICRSETILLINSDTRLRPGCLEALCDYLDQNKSVSVVGPRIVYPDGTPQTSTFYYPTPLHFLLYLSGLYKFIRYVPILRRQSLQATSKHAAGVVPSVLGAAFAFRRTAFESIGGFDESFFMYCEEMDLCFRLAKSGHLIHFAPVTEILHFGGASTAQRQAEMNVIYFSSHAHFYRKHYSRFRQVVLVMMVRFFALFRLLRDAVRILITRDEQKRTMLATNLKVSKILLFGEWHKQANLGGVILA